jgi:hypothetical protein
MTREMRQRGGGRRRVLVTAMCTLLSVAAVAAWKLPGTPPARSTDKVTVSVDASGKAAGAIGNQFIGLSFESSTLNNGYRYQNVGNLAQLLRNLGSSVMRFGGDSADTSYADTGSRVLDGLDSLAGASGWTVLWTENLAGFNAARVTADAKALHAALGSRLFAIACGNEPDQYSYERLRPASYTAADYVSAVNTCYRAIRAGDPHAPIEGPDTAWNAQWLAAYAGRETGALRVVGQHYYPLGCATPNPSPTARLSRLLSAGLASTEAKTLAGYVAAARPAHAPLMITETNSACDGGVQGLSNAYASALWVIDFLLTGAEQGIDGMNFHGGLNTLCGGYTVLCQVGPDSYRPQPIYYGMYLTHLLGTGGFLPVTIAAAASSAPVAAFAVKPPSGGERRVMLENLGKAPVDTTLRVSGYRGSAKVLKLTGPAPLSTTGIKIQGASVAGNGTLAPGQPDTVKCTSAGCQLTMAPYSAALVTLS